VLVGLVRVGAAAAAVPFTGLLRLSHRLLTGREAVLEVVVDKRADLADRTAALHRLRRAGRDACVGAVLLRLRNAPGGWAACQDLRHAIAELRATGRPVYAWLESPGNAVTWLASACDRVFLVPTGEVGLLGVGVEMTFFGAALGRLGVRPDFEAAGAYKSFGEPWTRSYPSPANQEAVRDLVADLQEQLIAGIATGRRRSEEEVRDALDRAPLSARDALDAGLVDELMYEDQLLDWIKERHGKRARLVPFGRWAARDALDEWLSSWGRGGQAVSILHLQGPIVLDGRQAATTIDARKVVPILKRLREDDRVGAVVLHVDSPGGSALASDLIWREVEQLRRNKPVVASFEDVAASGGFYLSAPANAILVRPATLTGSIGVFGGKLVLAEGLRRVGVHTSEILGAPNANVFSATRHFSVDQRSRFKESLQRFYDGFVSRVAKGRGVAVDQIEPHCRGRVWTGRAAQDRGLVDQPGTLDDAVERARLLAGLKEGEFVRRELVGHHEAWWARLAQGLFRQALPGNAARLAEIADRLLVGRGGWMLEVAAAHPNEPLAMLPFDLEVR
jgi:protease IV